MRLLSSLFVLFGAFLVGAQVTPQPNMVYLVNRHGVREARDTSTYEGGALLLQSAYDRLYTKGQHLRQQYSSLLSPTYKTTEIRVNSSSWERTITTAHGILAGLYSTNDTRSIPVYSTPWEADFTLYNYDKCPAYDQRVASFIQSPEYIQASAKYSNLTSYLNSYLAPKTPITLANIFSTWDLYWIQKNRPEVGQLAKLIDDYTYSTLTEAANWMETKRYSTSVSGDLLGSTLLAAIRYRMRMFINKDKVFSHPMIISSAHYATQLNLLAALGYTGVVSQSIPDYNSVLAFELYNVSSVWKIKIKYWDGTVSAFTPVALGSCAEGQDCWYDYTWFWNTYAVKDLQAWCKDCNSSLPMCLGYTSPAVPNSVCDVPSSKAVDNVQLATLILVAIILAAQFGAYVSGYRWQDKVVCGSPKHSELTSI